MLPNKNTEHNANLHNLQAEKVALVTGSARRIGAAIVNYLHDLGYQVIVHYHQSHQAAAELTDSLNRKRAQSALLLQADLRLEQACLGLIKAAVSWKGRLDLLVNNASVFIKDPSEGFDLSSWSELLDCNVKAPYLLSLAARPALARVGGVIINIADIHGEKPLSGYAAYCQSKAALIMQTKALARELAPEVRVNAVSPGAIAWPEKANSLSTELQAKIIAKTPLNRHGDPLFIAQAVAALAENSFITGQVLAVDGGRSIS